MADAQRPSEVASRQAYVRGMNDELVRATQTTDPEELTIHCECGRVDCATELMVNADVYQGIRGRPSQFMVVTGHHVREVGLVLRRLGAVSVVKSTYVGTVPSEA